MRKISNIYRLGVKEFWSLLRDPVLQVLIVYSFTGSIYVAATGMPGTLNNAAIAIVDEDQSVLSTRIIASFHPPHFMPPEEISLDEVDPGLDMGTYTFVLNIPPYFQRDVLAGDAPALQLLVDATRISQAFSGSGAIHQTVLGQVNEFVQGRAGSAPAPVALALRARFNPVLEVEWFASVMEIINRVTMLSILLAGAALIREREHGTVEHLLVMPVTPGEIMVAKIWSMGLVVLVGTAFALTFIVRMMLGVPIEGSVALFLFCATLHLFATTSMGIFMATVARSMPEFGILLILTILPLRMLSGSATPRESMPEFVQNIMLAAPTTHFVSAAQAILYRGAGFDVVWPQCLVLMTIGMVFFIIALTRFRKTIETFA